MIKPDIPKIKAFIKKLQVKKPWDSIIIFVLNVLIAIPLFIIIHQNIVDPEWPLHIDRILIFITMVVAIQLILRLLKHFLIFCIAVYILVLLFGSVFGNYGFNSVYEDYEAMVYTMAYDPNPQDLIISKLLPFPNKSKIIDAVDYTNPRVRNYAVGAATKYFKDVKGYHEHRLMIQCFSVFKDIRNKWNYVNDPRNAEYIASGSESILHFSGDCDDHAILMAACIRAVGGTPRIIHTGGHLYPEMLVGTKADLELANYLIKEELFTEESRGKEVHYHEDEYGQIWLNLDYTARFPGGPFMSEEILGALTFN
ncbi:transglutaminase [Flavobacterium zepuense]|uniref:Transglutaminase n=1 Tax=Flavobacterium zepuense TaxID=2593302 RepID=A0A552V1P8_9FLAO|nr:transglutaminase [Flavobacterium zepuense]TRW24387.1 transglutaminase [Flavobacterium zepuense]